MRGDVEIQQLGNAKIEKLRHPVRRHQNVTGLEISVNDLIAVRVFNR